MLEPMYLGLDCGTSGLKALLTDDGGAPVATAARSYSPDRPRPGWSEQNPDVWRTAMAGAIADLKSSSSRALGGLKAIGFSGQMHGAVVLDRSDRPVRPAILHNDGRAVAEAADLARGHPRLAGVVGVKPMPGFTGPKLLWLARHEPDNRRRIASVLSPKDYLRLFLVGDHGTDMSDAAGTWMLDEAARAWSERGDRSLRRRGGLGAAAVRGIGRGRQDPPQRRRRAWTSARDRYSRRRRRRRGGRGGLGDNRLGRGLHFPRNGDAAHRRDGPLPERARQSSCTASPTPFPVAGTPWPPCSTAPARSPSLRDCSARRPTRFKPRPPTAIGAPAISCSSPISPASARRSTTLMRAAFSSA